MNFKKFLKTQDGKHIRDEFKEYDDTLTAFDRNSKIGNYFRDYQFEFIKNWSISAQELVILYYGVGSGKTLIAVNCAEQYISLNNNSVVYFLTPASLVLNTIEECYKHGINPDAKYPDGSPKFYFVSYQQLLRSSFDFKDNSLIILDECHNLRNLKTESIFDKVSARKYEVTENFSLVGNKLASKLILSSSKFLRSIFMSGTLFVNSPADLETIISIGYKKFPLLNKDKEKYEIIQADPEEFKLYYEGLISFYRIPSDAPQFPTIKYNLIPIEVEQFQQYKQGENPYMISSRLEAVDAKVEWTIQFIENHKNDKTLVYSQFLNNSLRELEKELKRNNITYGIIDGSMSQTKKMDVKNDYNNDKIKVLIFTLSIKEGISFKETKNFILLEPYWNYSIFEQVMARAIRLDSHKKGKNSILEIYLPIITTGTEKEIQWFKDTAKILKDGIKNYVKPLSIEEMEKLENSLLSKEELEKKLKEKHKNKGKKSRWTQSEYNNPNPDMNMYERMIGKQGSINAFEKKILSIPQFEEVNNIENNEFIEEYNTTVLKMEHEENRLMSLKEKLLLKKSMYADFYKQNIKDIGALFVRADDDTRYKENRNPNLEEIADNKNYPNREAQIRDLVKRNASLTTILETFDINKKEITSFQANFTPQAQVLELIKFSDLENDTKQNIKILEPTAGIGGVISEVVKLKNNQNLMIDCNELHKIFYQVGKTIFENIETVKWYCMDFYDYRQKYNYDYILANPPFNLRTQVKEAKKVKGSKQFEIKKVDTTLYDVDFIALAYDMLNVDGVLCFIISDRFQRDKSSKFVNFNGYLDVLREAHPNYVSIKKVEHSFREDKNITKKMETSYSMVYIRLIKLSYFSMDLDQNPKNPNFKEPKKKKENQENDESDEEEPQPIDELDEFSERPKKKATTKKTKNTTKEIDIIPEEIKMEESKLKKKSKKAIT